MLVSFQWLNEHFKGNLTDPEELAELLTLHAFEIEGLEKKGDDTILDIDVLPNRASDCLSHRGIAFEIGTLLDQETTLPDIFTDAPDFSGGANVSVSLEEDSCRRYIATEITGLNTQDSPAWVQNRLKAIGQKSINNVVDATNLVMLESGQPMHAFDADKLSGGITVRKARAGESITTLDETEIALDEETLVIADDKGPLAIAGIKGGTKAIVDENTQNIVLEAANFDPVSVRKTAGRLGIHTDSSKRFENEVPLSIAPEAMKMASALLKEIASSEKTVFHESVEVFSEPKQPEAISVDLETISSILGISLESETFENILRRLGFTFEKSENDYRLTPPEYRLDIQSLQDVAEEIGRVYGYTRIPGIELSSEKHPDPQLNQTFFALQKIRDMLTELGFSEVLTHTFGQQGERQVQNPIAEGRQYLRGDLTSSVREALTHNVGNAPLLGVDVIQIFEIGNVFDHGGEHPSLAIGVRDTTKKGKNAAAAFEKLSTRFQKENIELPEARDGVIEVSLHELIPKISLPENPLKELSASPMEAPYQTPSSYPFVLRDLAVFTPEGTSAETILSVVSETAGELLVKSRLFDVFEKTLEDGTQKVSYAYHLVFQSRERTLSDDEVGEIMHEVEKHLNDREGFEVR